jgi:polygalacturonase
MGESLPMKQRSIGMKNINIPDFGAISDTGKLCTREIQAALDTATANHGATVIILESNRAFCIMTSSGTGLAENILVNNMRLDTHVCAGNWWRNGEPVAIIATKNNIANYAAAVPDRHFPVNVRNVQFQNLICSGENAIGIVGEKGNIQDVIFNNLAMELKDSENLPIKGRLIDASPGAQTTFLPDSSPYWLHVQGAKDIRIKNARIAPYKGVKPGISMKDCTNVVIEAE